MMELLIQLKRRILQYYNINRTTTIILVLIALLWIILVVLLPVNNGKYIIEEVGVVVVGSAVMISPPSTTTTTTTTTGGDERTTTTATSSPLLSENHHISTSNDLNMTICVDKCKGEDCKTYITPLGKCFNSDLLFPNDPTWNGLDVYDVVMTMTTTGHNNNNTSNDNDNSKMLFRTIFHSSDSSCTPSPHDDDHFEIPLDTCVGPFGKPRPWGIFTLYERQQPTI